MKRKLISAASFFAALFIILTAYFIISDKLSDQENDKSEQVVAVNEIKQLIISGDTDTAIEKADALTENIRKSDIQKTSRTRIITMGLVGLLCVLVIFAYVYFSIIRPFDKMKSFAGRIAQGNFDLPLEFERSNYFGDFTWAFDNMRHEIIKARKCEKEAIENNKTVIATLSHDIKTPIASIRAYAEGLEANMDTSIEKRQKYVSVIMRKCDEVSKLTNDLFLHSISDLDKLQIEQEEFEMCSFLEMAVAEISAENNDVRLSLCDDSVIVNIDKNRLKQIVENLINNARKYAQTQIDISIIKSGNNVEINFRDYGPGIMDEDIPFIFDKFYRGKNCENKQGSGLGLYIVKYLTEKMGGNVQLQSSSSGLNVTVIFPTKNNSLRSS